MVRRRTCAVSNHEAPVPPSARNQKAGPRPAALQKPTAGVPGRSRAPPGLESYFFFDFLAFFAFFAFFAFLAIVSSQGLMDGNATREACSAEGQPRNILAC